MKLSKQHRTDMAARGLRPATELAAGRAHGDSLRYISGCRCAECRAANSAYERQRQAARRAGGWNGLVSAEPSRAHMLALSSRGIGRRAVQAATDIADSVLSKIRSGERTRIRAATERAILSVTADMASDHAMVDAGPSWALILELTAAGFTKVRIARELGQNGPGLQLGRERITVRNAARVKRAHAQLMASGEALVDAAPSWSLIEKLRVEFFRDERIARELGFEDGVLRIGRRRISQALAKHIDDTYRRLIT